MVKFNKLFEVRLFHQYYEAITSKDLVIYPSTDTQNLLKSFGIIFKQTSEGLILLYNEDKRFLLEKLRDELTLSFAVSIKNKYFETFSNVVPSTETKKYLFSNRQLDANQTDNQNAKDQEIKLHANGFVSEKNVCLCCYNNLILKELLGDDKVLIQQNGETIHDGELEYGQSASRILKNGFGIYEVTTTGLEQAMLLYLPDSYNKIFGIIDLAIGGNDKSFESTKGSVYQISFDSRQVQWNYFFISESGKSYDTVNLFAGKDQLPFSQPEVITLMNGQRAIKVQSEQLYSLKNRYTDQSFTAELLTDTQGTLGDVGNKKLNLITPDVTRIKGKRENGSEVYYSDMYIYI